MITLNDAQQLLQGFLKLQVTADPSSVVRLRQFLSQFTLAQQNTNRADYADAQSQAVFLGKMLKGFAAADERWCQTEKTTATVFNVLEALGVSGRELLHSKMLGWLLSRNIRDPGSHAQGSLGFGLFLKKLNLPLNWAETHYSVRREVQGHKSRIDIEIACPTVFLIHIENKVWAGLGENQLDREADDLNCRAEQLRVKPNARVGIFLTPTGKTSNHKMFHPLSWSDVSSIFERFAEPEYAQAPMVRLFAAHYAEAIRMSIAGYNYKQEEDDGEADV